MNTLDKSGLLSEERLTGSRLCRGHLAWDWSQANAMVSNDDDDECWWIVGSMCKWRTGSYCPGVPQCWSLLCQRYIDGDWWWRRMTYWFIFPAQKTHPLLNLTRVAMEHLSVYLHKYSSPQNSPPPRPPQRKHGVNASAKTQTRHNSGYLCRPQRHWTPWHRDVRSTCLLCAAVMAVTFLPLLPPGQDGRSGRKTELASRPRYRRVNPMLCVSVCAFTHMLALPPCLCEEFNKV